MCLPEIQLLLGSCHTREGWRLFMRGTKTGKVCERTDLSNTAWWLRGRVHERCPDDPIVSCSAEDPDGSFWVFEPPSFLQSNLSRPPVSKTLRTCLLGLVARMKESGTRRHCVRSNEEEAWFAFRAGKACGHGAITSLKTSLLPRPFCLGSIQEAIFLTQVEIV